MQEVICAAIIKNKSILLVEKKGVWILPGGKPLESESDIECLNREIIEELSNTAIINTKFYKSFEGIAPHTKVSILAKVYFADINGLLKKPSGEISSIAWVSDFSKYNLSKTAEKIIYSLKRDKLL